jgi:hypothetical protein
VRVSRGLFPQHPKMNSLPRIRPGLLRHPLEQQLLVYDTGSERVHLLDSSSAILFELLTETGWTFETITFALAERTGIAPSRELVDLALEELRSAGLLDETIADIAPMPDVNRREALRSLAVAGAAAVLLPAITTLTATRAYGQGSGATGVGGSCSSNGQCMSGHCCGGTCRATACNGDTCANDGQCFSGHCCGGVCAASACTTASCGVCSSTADCLPPRTCISGTGGNRCSGGTNQTAGLSGSSCSAGPGSSCTQQRNAANTQCCSGNCVAPGNVCTGSGSNQTWSGTCA